MRIKLVPKEYFFSEKQHGFTLIEIMVGLLLSAFLLSATINIFITTKQSYRSKENIARAQENATFAFEMMRQVINLAEPGQVTVADSNQMTVGYRGRVGITDCLGRPAETTTSIYFNRFYINSDQLVCQVTTSPATTTDAQPIVDNISAMTIQYGIDGFSDPNIIDGVNINIDGTIVDPGDYESLFPLTTAQLDQILSARVTLRLIVNPNPLETRDITFTAAMLPRIISRVNL